MAAPVSIGDRKKVGEHVITTKAHQRIGIDQQAGDRANGDGVVSQMIEQARRAVGPHQGGQRRNFSVKRLIQCTRD